MVDTKLNLSRKLRVRDFDHIIGQTLAVRMLKNSLYLGHYFPVYLFSGQRGCGKTTMARVFATAVNCVQLISFQKNPKIQQLPCLACDSCRAMATGTHPDFIEMDAASHTGVDNVRQIIDAASLLPVMGVKKIYLIDEAHMLSKAAFNALLKILEEPPMHALFILATTDPQKIIDTVKSRCFQLLFKAVEESVLLSHLQQVCDQEKIAYEKAGLSLIIRETEGSVRDALNIVEQVRFSAGSITSQAVLQVLDHLDTGSFIHIIELIFAGNVRALLSFLKMCKLERFAAEYIWPRFVGYMRALLWYKHGVILHDHEEYDALNRLGAKHSLTSIMSVMQRIYDNEELFLKTTAQHLFLEMFFVQLCSIYDDNRGSSAPPQAMIGVLTPAPSVNEQEDGEPIAHDGTSEVQEMNATPVVEIAQPPIKMHDGCAELWQKLIISEAVRKAPLVHSVLSQGVCLRIEPNEQGDKVIVQFGRELAFFETVVHDERPVWYPQFQQLFSPKAMLVMEFTGEPKAAVASNKNKEKSEFIERGVASAAPVRVLSEPSKDIRVRARENHDIHGIDISDTAVWKTTHMVLHHFPGVVREVEEVRNG